MTADGVLRRYLAGDISAEIALMQLLLGVGTLDAVRQCLTQPGFEKLAAAAVVHRAGLQQTAAIVEAGLASERGGITAIREQFDRAVALAPEAAVALYSLGSPEILRRATDEIVARLRDWRLIGPHSSVLDIGCGIGRLEAALAPQVAAITGIDVSPEMIAEARRRCAALGNVTLACCSGVDLAELAGSAYDLVLAVDSFPYLVAAGPAIADRHVADTARLLRPGGTLAIFNYSYSGDPGSDRRAIAGLAREHGFAVERDGTRDFALWDGMTFLLRPAAGR